MLELVKNTAFRSPMVMPLLQVIWGSFLSFIFGIGCSQEPLTSGLSASFETNCSFCHGNDDNAAPPLSLNGLVETSEPGVGAHQAHLKANTIANGIACEACHIVPEAVDDPGHQAEGPNDGQAEVVFSGLAKAENLEPLWDRVNLTCAKTYCHGTTLAGGNHREPLWTRVDESQIDCDGCHGSPPPSPHPQAERTSDCGNCHPDTVDENGNIRVSGGMHLNGIVDRETECHSCHGKENGNDAPPFSLDGSEDSNEIGVGAHQSHLKDGKISTAVDCQECHIVPDEVDDPGHQPDTPDDTHAEVTFGALAKTQGLDPNFDRETVRCTNTYCHGTTLTGGNHREPLWTRVDESQIDCDGCHGNPPPSPHPQGKHASNCMACHPGTVDKNGDIKIAEGRHINGKIDRETECTSCHGKEGINEAPPYSVDGSEDTDDIGVGAHQSHLQVTRNRNPIACEECHLVPEAIDDPGHQPQNANDTHAEVIFGDLAASFDLQPDFDPQTTQCTNTYCHGATLKGGNHNAPLWTRVDGAQIECDGCHGNPPPPPHLQGIRATNCESCHPNTVDGDGNIILARGQHIDGKIDAITECTTCHGKEGVNEAPPYSVDGSEDTNDTGVGAHQSHLLAGTVAGAIACQECHVVPDKVSDPSHLMENIDDTHAEVTFGHLANTQDLGPMWSSATDRCTNTYCHGAGLTGGDQLVPIWTRVDGTQIECDSCHGNPPPKPHPQGVWASDCATCHPNTVDEGGSIRVTNGSHINGELDVVTSCTVCHGRESVNAAPPFALDRAENTDDLGVGAHQTHVQAGTITGPIQCDECHLVPENIVDADHFDELSDDMAELVFGAMASHESLTPLWDRANARCTNTYCHGTTLSGGNYPEPIWNQVDGSQSGCDGCHGFPPPPPHINNKVCSICHPSTVLSDQMINLESGTHINGEINVAEN